jgi:hypothetical protein
LTFAKARKPTIFIRLSIHCRSFSGYPNYRVKFDTRTDPVRNSLGAGSNYSISDAFEQCTQVDKRAFKAELTKAAGLFFQRCECQVI